MKSLEQRYPHLQDPRALVGPRAVGWLLVPDGHAVAAALDNRAAQIAATDIALRPALVVIQGRHIPKSGGHSRGGSVERRADRILETAESIRKQRYAAHLAIAATVEEGFSLTGKQAERFADLGIRRVSQEPDANAAQSLADAVKRADVPDWMVVPVAAGNRFATNQALRAGALHIGNGAIGAYGPLVLDHNPSSDAYRLLGGNQEYYLQDADCDNWTVPGVNGFMSDAGAVIDGHALDAAPLDESYGSGGAVSAWAGKLQARPGDVMYDPALAVHDSRAYAMDWRMLREEAELLGPTEYQPPRT